MRKDQLLFRRRQGKLQKKLKKGQDISAMLAKLERAVERSVKSRAERLNSIPKIQFPDLPIADRRKEIEQAILDHQVVIVCGETGSGKTTQLPKICLSVGRGGAGLIGHTQPRRIAARSVAVRIAEEFGENIGQSVGYKIRFQDKTRPGVLLKLMTDGILLAETQSDPYLDQYDTLIIDEAHERSLNIDFLLGYVKWLLPRRPDLKLIITSATIDPEKFSKHFGNAPVIEVSGRVYPVEIRYRGMDTDQEKDQDLQQALVDAVDEIISESTGDILVFLAGERDIRDAAETLRKQHHENYDILPLYSRLSEAEQARIFQPHNKIRIILSTNIAETSLTVPGVRCVIDAGTARISRYSPRSKLQRLPIERVSKASAMQRAGRCGRLGPGVCIRLYSEADFESRPEHTDPEILRTNLASVILAMKTLKLGDVEKFPFVDAPDERMVRDGVKLLEELTAIDDKGNLTPLGYKLGRFPIDPRLGRMLLAAENESCLSEIIVIVAALSIQDPRERPVDYAQAADKCHAQFKDGRSDFIGFLNLWTHLQKQKRRLSSNKFRNYCRDNLVSYRRLLEWQEIQQQLLQLIKGELQMKPNEAPGGYDAIHRSLLFGLLSNVGARNDSAEYLGARNQKFFIHPSSSQFNVKPKWIISSERVETTRVYARYVAQIDPLWVESVGAHLIKRNYYEPHWEKKVARVAVFEQVRLFGLIVLKGRKVPFENINPVGAREIFIRSALVNFDYHTNANFFRRNQALLDSLNYLHHKGRRVDLMIDEEIIYQFYDKRLPEFVFSGHSFDQWRKKAEKKDPDILRLTKEYLEGDKSISLKADEFPDHLQLGPITLKLRYHFEPGHDKDGVTVAVPLHQLNQLEAARFEMIVPGLLKEKIIASIKALPKSIRRNLVPAPYYADRCLDALDKKSISFYSSLAALLTKMSGIPIEKSIWNDAHLEPHLQFNFCLVDENFAEIESSRDLNFLKKKYGAQAGVNFRELTSGTREQRTGRTKWDFGELAERVEINRDEQRLIGYPALIDEGGSVGVRTFDAHAEAKVYHRDGLIRLFQLVLSKEVRFVMKNIKLSTEAALAYARLPSHPIIASDNEKPDVREEVVRVAVGKAFVDDKSEIRCSADFEKRLDENKSELIITANHCTELFDEILINHKKVCEMLVKSGDSPSVADIKEQIGLLVYNGFLGRTPYDRLLDIPRYLEAARLRVHKQRENAQRDHSKLNELMPFWTKYWNSVKSRENRYVTAPEFDPFRWSLEEFRVSLFAQILKTAFPISAKRMEKAWQERSRGCAG